MIRAKRKENKQLLAEAEAIKQEMLVSRMADAFMVGVEALKSGYDGYQAVSAAIKKDKSEEERLIELRIKYLKEKH